MKNATSKVRKPKRYAYDLPAAETQAIDAINRWFEVDSSESRLDMYLKIRDLTTKILKVSNYFSTFPIDVDETANDYSLYLFERILNGSFVMIPKTKKKVQEKRFPLQNYINLNLKHIVITQSSNKYEFIEDIRFALDNKSLLEYLEETTSIKESSEECVRSSFLNEILAVLNLYYPISEIERLFNICLEHIIQRHRMVFNAAVPDDVKDFSLILLATVRRISTEYPYFKGMSKDKYINPDLSLFLSTVSNSMKVDKKLLLSLDLDSIYRLTYICGGQKVQIPSRKELDILVGSALALKTSIEHGVAFSTALYEIKRKFDLDVSTNIKLNHIKDKIKTLETSTDSIKKGYLGKLYLECISSLCSMVEDSDDSSLINKSKELSKHIAEFIEEFGNKLDERTQH